MAPSGFANVGAQEPVQEENQRVARSFCAWENFAVQCIPGKPVAYYYGLLWLIYGLLWGIVACYFGLLGVPGKYLWRHI